MTYQPPPAQFGSPTDVEPPLDQPWYGIGFGAAFKRAFKKYATFSGRASRGEFWWFFLANWLISLVPLALMIIGVATAPTRTFNTYSGGFDFTVQLTGLAIVGYVLAIFWSLAVLIPGLALVWRRLHDTGRSGAFYFITLVPFVGPIILLVFLCSDAVKHPTQFDFPPGTYYQQPVPGGFPPPGAYPAPGGYPPQAGYQGQIYQDQGGYPPPQPGGYPPPHGYPPQQ